MTTTLTIETFPDEAAAAYIRGKVVADPENFGKLPAQLKQRAFTVAGIEQMDVLRKLRDTIAKLPEGTNWDEAKRGLTSQISSFTGADKKAARRRAEFMLRTHGFQAYSVARHQQQMSVRQDFPYWKYETVGDSRVRAGHAALDGKVVRADDPWWKTHYPPWDWGCRCIVIQLDEEDAQAIGITSGKEMPTPERSGSFLFDPTNASLDFDKLREGYDDADWRLFAASCRQATVQADGRESETMWELMLDQKMDKTAKELVRATQRDGRERAVVFDYMTGKTLSTAMGNTDSVETKIPSGVTVGTLHTHTNGDNTPSPQDLFSGFGIYGDFDKRSRVEYIAAGKRLRRWTWLKVPEPEDARRINDFNADNKAGRLDFKMYESFLDRLVKEGFIKMEVLP